MTDLVERVGRVRLWPTVIGLAAWLTMHLTLVATSPSDYWRIVVIRPETPAAVIGSWLTFFEWAASSSPVVAAVLIVTEATFVAAFVVFVTDAVRGDPA